MPGLNRTGPVGAGPRTGRGRGLCRTYAGRGNTGVSEAPRGVGRGGTPWGCGKGRCFGGGGTVQGEPGFSGQVDLAETEDTEMLRAKLKTAEQDIADLKARLEELASK